MNWLNDLLNHPPTGEIAEACSWTDFCASTQALSEQLPAGNIALWFEDAACFASALFAAWQAGCTVYLPPNDNAENRSWAAANYCLWLTDQADNHDNAFFYKGKITAAAQSKPFAIADHATLLLKTSGSSGTAKIVRKTALQMQAEAHALSQILPWRDVRALSSVSAQHLYGLTFRIFTALRCGWQLGRAQLRYPEHLLAESHAPCIWIASPALLTRLADKTGWETLNIHGILSAGGALPLASAQDLHDKLGFYPTDIYGSTETGVIALRERDAPWCLLPDVQVGLSEQGTLWAQSPWTDGREQTADVADIHGNTLHLQGRADRIIKFEDKRISLTRLEHDFLTHPFVLDAHCARHPEHGRIAAWIALNDAGIAHLRQSGRGALIAALKNHLSQSQDAIALPRFWRFTHHLPRDAQGKIRQQDFAQVFTAAQLAPDWQLLHEDEHQVQFRGIVPLDLLWFGGHFAEFPLVPGVVEVQWAMTLAARYPWAQSEVLRLENLKYQQFVRPNDDVQLDLRWDDAKRKLHFAIHQGDSMCASGRMVFA